jgi:hypothetical protein
MSADAMQLVVGRLLGCTGAGQCEVRVPLSPSMA